MSIIKALFGCLVAVSLCIGQNVSVSGTVKDRDGTAIAGASVMLENGGQTATTGADGSFTLTGVGIIGQVVQSLSQQQFLTISNGLLCVKIREKSAVEIVTFNLQGKALSTVQKTMDAGIHSIALSHIGAGVYFYKVKIGSSKFVIKSISIGGVSKGTAVSVQGSSITALTKHARSNPVFEDVIAITKDGYLNYRMIVTNSDTSGIEIKMIVCEGTVTDADGNVYQTARIGNQVWMIENLRTTKYNDGSAIPLVTDSIAWSVLSTPGYCYYNNTTNADSSMKYGALYNWYAVDTKKLAPTGWHVPYDAEWDTLQNYLIANGYNWDGSKTGNKIAKSLAAQADWITSGHDFGIVGYDLTKNNKSGFSALPGGYRLFNGIFYRIGFNGYWWNATEYDSSNAYFRSLRFITSNLHGHYYYKSCGYSVRLLRD